MRVLKLFIVLLSVVIAVPSFALAIIAFLPAKTAPLAGPDPIAVLERIELGGVEQTVLIRGVDRRNPVLLYVHGGPGMGVLPLTRFWAEELEKHFVVVAWDQRGAGASCSSEVPEETMTLDQVVQDTLELAGILGKRFGPDDRIYLLGHSWGSVVGTLAAQRRPEAFHAYIGLGQAVHGQRNEEVSYQFTLNEAKRRNDAVALAELEAIAPPYGRAEALETQRPWLVAFGGTFYNLDDARAWVWPALFGREYTLATRLGFASCMRNSMDAMWDEFLEIDFYQQVPRLDLPVYLLLGRRDYNTPFELAAAWAEQLVAPKVEVIWFEDVAHVAPLEAPDAFQRALIERVLAETPP
jgi:pimeloyl-ACP methyl ester carboxylesterase